MYNNPGYGNQLIDPASLVYAQDGTPLDPRTMQPVDSRMIARPKTPTSEYENRYDVRRQDNAGHNNNGYDPRFDNSSKNQNRGQSHAIFGGGRSTVSTNPMYTNKGRYAHKTEPVVVDQRSIKNDFPVSAEETPVYKSIGKTINMEMFKRSKLAMDYKALEDILAVCKFKAGEMSTIFTDIELDTLTISDSNVLVIKNEIRTDIINAWLCLHNNTSTSSFPEDADDIRKIAETNDVFKLALNNMEEHMKSLTVNVEIESKPSSLFSVKRFINVIVSNDTTLIEEINASHIESSKLVMPTDSVLSSLTDKYINLTYVIVNDNILEVLGKMVKRIK